MTRSPEDLESQWADATVFETALLHLGFGPGEGIGVFVVGLDEGAAVLAEVTDGGEGGTMQ